MSQSRRNRFVLIACILGSSIVFVDGSVVNVALPSIQHDLSGGLALQQWVEHGVAPEQLIATKYLNDNPASGVAFTRPLCKFPKVAHYAGTGACTDAANWSCVEEQGNSTIERADEVLPDLGAAASEDAREDN